LVKKITKFWRCRTKFEPNQSIHVSTVAVFVHVGVLAILQMDVLLSNMLFNVLYTPFLATDLSMLL
jgi:hypothetical protein